MRVMISAAALSVLLLTQVPSGMSLNSKVAWDCVTTDILGNPEVIAQYEIGLFPLGAAGNTEPLRTALTPANPCTFQIRPLVDGVPDGQYDLRARAYDEAGNISLWSSPLSIDLDATPPAHPVNLRPHQG